MNFFFRLKKRFPLKNFLLNTFEKIFLVKRMACQLPTDCLNGIFDHLENTVTLRSCLLVSRLWCEASVPTLWARIQNYHTLIACLPRESKEILFKNDIVIATLVSRPPLFNYVAFIKILS